jgi:hypothetical protein
MSDIVSMLSQYELLELAAQHLSTLDILSLALTCSKLYTLIRRSENIFNRLKRVALCDGNGLKERQEFRGIYEPHPWRFGWTNGMKAHHDEEIEVRLYNLKCDAANALPCIKCDVNVCEVRTLECRSSTPNAYLVISGMPIFAPGSRWPRMGVSSTTTCRSGISKSYCCLLLRGL